MEEKFRKRLALWKRQYISKGGRITLIRSTLVSMPLFLMSLFRISTVVSKRLEKIQRDFLWGGVTLERKPYTVRWETVCTNRDKGGLGVRRLSNLNRALLGKWIWIFAIESKAPLRAFISLKYGIEASAWFPKGVRGSYGVSIWKEILKEAPQLKVNSSFKVGKGDRMRFWEDSCCSEVRLCDLFPRLYSLARSKEAKVMEVWENSEQGGGWNLCFERPFYDFYQKSLNIKISKLGNKNK